MDILRYGLLLFLATTVLHCTFLYMNKIPKADRCVTEQLQVQ